MTEQQKKSFAELYKEYAQRYSRFGRSQISIKAVCAKAHEWAKASSFANDEAIKLLIEKQGNGISNVGRSVVYLQRTKSTKRDEAIRSLLSEMFNATKNTGEITRVQYDTWKTRFFATVEGHQLEVIFNRLIFAIFPEQFCSVAKPERLLRICNAIQKRTGVRLTLTDKMLADVHWLDLCELIVPIVREALPNKDYAARSTFLAAIGVEVDGNYGLNPMPKAK